jgi:23S rRNA pseudouridine2605 synthase
VRINRFLASCGVGSRRSVEDVIRAGRVTLDGEKVKSLSIQVTDDSIVEVDGQRVLATEGSRVVLFHKPANVMTTRDDPQGRPTIYHLLPESMKRLVYAGRLDFPSRGLVVLTDDGELLHRLTHPRWDHPKKYVVELDAPLSEQDLSRIREGGIVLPGEAPLKPVLAWEKGRFVTLELREGRYRQIRRMMEVLERDVLDLCRIGVGQWTLDGLEAGQWRELDTSEIDPMRVSLDLPPRASLPRKPGGAPPRSPRNHA